MSNLSEILHIAYRVLQAIYFIFIIYFYVRDKVRSFQ